MTIAELWPYSASSFGRREMKSLWNWGSITCDENCVEIHARNNYTINLLMTGCLAHRMNEVVPNGHLHHVPDLLRFTALYELVKGQQALCMGPSGELRHPVQNLLWGVLLVRNELTAMHSQAWSRPRAVVMNMIIQL